MTFVSLYFLIYASVVFGEIVEIPDLCLYHVTPTSDIQLLSLNRFRTSDTGMIFIHGVGTVGEVTEVLASAKVLDYYEKELSELNLKFDLQFTPVTIEMFDNTPDYNITEQLEKAGKKPIVLNDLEDEDEDEEPDFNMLSFPDEPNPNSTRKVRSESEEVFDEYVDDETRRKKREAGDMYELEGDKNKKNEEHKKGHVKEDKGAKNDMYDLAQNKNKQNEEHKKGNVKEDEGPKNDMYELEKDKNKKEEEHKKGKVKEDEAPKNDMYDPGEDKGHKKSKVEEEKKESLFGEMNDFEEGHTKTTAKPKAHHSTKHATKKSTPKPKSKKTSKPHPKQKNATAAPPPGKENFYHNVPKLMPIEAIVEPSLYSGVFLNIAGTGIGNISILTVGGKENSTMNNPYLCLSTENEVDPLDPAGQWLFEKSEKPHYYVLRNRKIPHAYISWEDDEQQFLVVELRREFQSQYKNPIHPLRHNVLFRIEKHNPRNKTKVKPEDAVLYQLKIKGRDGENTRLVIDAELKDSTGCLLLRRTPKEVSYDGDKLRYLFTLERAISSLKIVGILGDMKYKETSKELFKRSLTEGTVMTLETKTLFNHRNVNLTAELIELHERSDTFRLVFSKSMRKSVFSEILVPPGLSIGNIDDTDTGNRSRSTTFVSLNLGYEKDTMERFKYKITGHLNLHPWKAAQYSIMFGWLDDLELNFETTVKILGRGDRMKASDPPRVVTNQVMNFKYVNEILQEINFQLGKAAKGSKNKNPHDPKAMYYEIPMKGKLIAKSLGIKGEVVLLFQDLQRKVNSTCHFNPSP